MDTGSENQIASGPKSDGRKKIIAMGPTTDMQADISKDEKPSPRPVKNDEQQRTRP